LFVGLAETCLALLPATYLPAFLEQANVPAGLTYTFEKTAPLFLKDEEHFVYLDNIKRTNFMMQALSFFCEMRSILAKKFGNLKMTVGNADFWNEAKLKWD
jgi:hypothetical protein